MKSGRGLSVSEVGRIVRNGELRLLDDHVEAVLQLELLPESGRRTRGGAYGSQGHRLPAQTRHDLLPLPATPRPRPATADVEGAIAHVLAKRCDQGGIRWSTAGPSRFLNHYPWLPDGHEPIRRWDKPRVGTTMGPCDELGFWAR